MAIFHRATISPTKEEVIARWAPGQPWGPAGGVPIEVIGSYRFDDPEGQVGMETFLLAADNNLFQVPLTYRAAPLPGSETGLISEMTHSVLGNRWVYDGLHDPLFIVMLAAVAMTGQGEALGLAVYDGRWFIAPTNIRIRGGGWTEERVAVDRFELVTDDVSATVLQNERFELKVFRRPVRTASSGMQLTATWPGQSEPVALATVQER